MQTRKQYLVLETLLSVIINGVMSVGFVFLIFRGQPHIPTMGRHGIVVDMAPQTLMVTLMGSLIPMLLARRRLAAGVLVWSGSDHRQGGAPFPVALSVALLACLLVVSLSWVTLPWLIPGGVDFRTLVIFKALVGGLLAFAVTPWAIARALR